MQMVAPEALAVIGEQGSSRTPHSMRAPRSVPLLLVGLAILFAASCRESMTPRPIHTADGPLRLIMSPDTLHFSRSRQYREVFVQVDGAGAASGSLQARWESSDSALARTPIPGPLGSAPLLIRSDTADGTAVLRLEVFTENESALDSVVVIVDRVAMGVWLEFTDERSLATGAFRGWRAVEHDSSGVELREVHVQAFSSDAAIVAAADSGVSAVAPGTADVWVTWNGEDLLRTTFDVVRGLDLGAVSTTAMEPLCPSLFDLTVAERLITMLLGGCLGRPGTARSVIGDNGVRWRTGAGPAAIHDGRSLVTAAGEPFVLRRHTASGEVLWERAAPQGSGSARSVALTSRGLAIVRTSTDHIVALDSSAHRWTMPIMAPRAVAAIETITGTEIVVVTTDSILRFEGDGQAISRMGSPGFTLSDRLAIAPDGTVFVWRSATNSIIAVSADGATQWETPMPFGAPPVYALPWLVHASTGQLIVAGNAEVLALGTDGSVLWNTPMEFPSRPVVASDGRVYVLTKSEGYVSALSVTDGVIIGRTDYGLGRAPLSADELALGGGMLLGTDGASLHWFEVPFRPAPGWSQVQGDGGRTNSIRRP